MNTVGQTSLTGAAVDALAQQIGMTDVPGILLDHMDEDIADGLRAVVENGQRAGKATVVLSERTQAGLTRGHLLRLVSSQMSSTLGMPG